MKNPILDILKLQEQNIQNSRVLEAQQKYNDQLLENQHRMDKFNYINETFGNSFGISKETIRRNKIKKDLLSEGIYRIFSKCVKAPLYENTEFLKRHLASSFVNENNVTELLNEYHDKTYMLSELTRLVLEYTDIILEKTKESESVDPNDKEEFYNKIDEIEDLGYVQDSIKARVSDAINRFNIDNLQKKKDIENQLIATREKINTNMLNDSVKEYTLMESKKKENEIRHSKKSIFEAMVSNVIESCYKNESVKTKFFDENNAPDMDKIIDHTKIMYGFLEMLNTTGMKDVKSEYIKEQVDSLKI